MSFDERIIIAGPCCAESYEQLYTVAEGLSTYFNGNKFYMRMGVWKPRTRPNSFEGYGLEALKWAEELKKHFNVSIVTEVATSKHIEDCLKHGIDEFWVGARSSSSPFVVQEIADALKGVEMRVWVKNPLSPDLSLWLGAIERLEESGKLKVGAIHRGFSLYNSYPYRNMPLWEVPIKLKCNYPHIPILCDPSHIAGNTELIPSLCQTAMDLEMDGLMVEVHPQPKVALSDSVQQLTINEFKLLLQQLVLRNKDANSGEIFARLEVLRSQLDKTDIDLISILKKRLQIVEDIGKIKKNDNLSILQSKRWQEVLHSRALDAEKTGLDPEFIRTLFSIIHTEAVKIQTKILNKGEI